MKSVLLISLLAFFQLYAFAQQENKKEENTAKRYFTFHKTYVFSELNYFTKQYPPTIKLKSFNNEFNKILSPLNYLAILLYIFYPHAQLLQSKLAITDPQREYELYKFQLSYNSFDF